MNRVLFGVALGGLILMVSCRTDVRYQRADDTPVVVGDYGSAVIESVAGLSEFTDVADTIIVHPDGKRKWATIKVEHSGQTASYSCQHGPCDVVLNFQYGSRLHIYTRKKTGLILESSAPYGSFRKDSDNKWVLATSGKVTTGSITIDGGQATSICSGGDCKVTISYVK